MTGKGIKEGGLIYTEKIKKGLGPRVTALLLITFVLWPQLSVQKEGGNRYIGGKKKSARTKCPRYDERTKIWKQYLFRRGQRVAGGRRSRGVVKGKKKPYWKAELQAFWRNHKFLGGKGGSEWLWEKVATRRGEKAALQNRWDQMLASIQTNQVMLIRKRNRAGKGKGKGRRQLRLEIARSADGRETF